MRPHRRRPLYVAFLAHRLSGLLLALFLPLHFLSLGLAIGGADPFDTFLEVADNPLVKGAEAVLVFLLALHFFGGLRLLALEFLPWRDWQKTLAAAAGAGASLVSGLFLLGMA